MEGPKRECRSRGLPRVSGQAAKEIGGSGAGIGGNGGLGRKVCGVRVVESPRIGGFGGACRRRSALAGSGGAADRAYGVAIVETAERVIGVQKQPPRGGRGAGHNLDPDADVITLHEKNVVHGQKGKWEKGKSEQRMLSRGQFAQHFAAGLFGRGQDLAFHGDLEAVDADLLVVGQLAGEVVAPHQRAAVAQGKPAVGPAGEKGDELRLEVALLAKEGLAFALDGKVLVDQGGLARKRRAIWLWSYRWIQERADRRAGGGACRRSARFGRHSGGSKGRPTRERSQIGT